MAPARPAGESYCGNVTSTGGNVNVVQALGGDVTGNVAANAGTVRRSRKFRIVKGGTYVWNNETTDSKGKAVKQNGEAVAAHDGVLTILGVKFGGRLVIKAK